MIKTTQTFVIFQTNATAGWFKSKSKFLVKAYQSIISKLKFMEPLELELDLHLAYIFRRPVQRYPI